MFHRPLLVLACLVLIAGTAQAQRLEITPFYGYQFGGDFEETFDHNDFNDVDLGDGESYGVLFDIGLSRNAQIELMFNRQETELEEDRLFGPALFDLDLEYYQVGLLYQWAPGQVRPFLVGSLGATRLEPEGLSGDTRFSWSFGGGVKLMFSESVGLRLEGRFYSTLIDADDDIFCDPFGCFAYDDSTYLYQFDAKAGIVFAF